MIVNLSIFMEQSPGHGEDRGISGPHHAFVFDGLGGAGARKRTNARGETRTEAMIASGAASAALDRLVKANWQSWADVIEFTDGETLVKQMRALVDQCIRPELKSALQKAAYEYRIYDKSGQLPTTIAGWLTFPAPDGRTLAVAVWAGDSRCYLLDEKGMRQCSRDTTHDYLDPMEELSSDCRLSSLLRNDQDFSLEFSCHLLDRPALLMCCSDGFYRGIESPMHLEYYFRSVLVQGETPEDMMDKWREFFLTPLVEDMPETNLLHDDSATMESIFVCGDEDAFGALKAMLAAPLEDLTRTFIDPFPGDPEAEETDIDRKIAGIAAELRKKEDTLHFYQSLRRNVERYVKEGAACPPDLPCSELVDQLRQVRVSLQEKHDRAVAAGKAALREKAEKQKRELDALVANVKKTVVLVTEAEPLPRIKALFDRGSLRDKVRDRFTPDHQWRELNVWYNELRVQIDHCFYGIFAPKLNDESRDVMTQQDIDNELRRLRVMMASQVFFTDRLAELASPERGAKIMDLRCQTARTEKRPLSPREAARLKEAVDRWVQGDEPSPEWNAVLDAPEAGVVSQALDLDAVFDLLKAKEAILRTEEAERDYSLPTADIEAEFEARLNEAFEAYKNRRPGSDAKFLLTQWYQSGRRPEYFQMERPLETTLEKGMEKLRDLSRRNDDIRRQREEIKQARYALWEAYRGGYEAWDEPFEYVPAPKIEEPADQPEDEPEKDAPADQPEDAPEKDAPADQPEDAPEQDVPADQPEDEPEQDAPADQPGDAPEKDAPADQPEDEPEKDAPADQPGDAPEKDAPAGRQDNGPEEPEGSGEAMQE